MPVSRSGRGQFSQQRAIIDKLARAVNLRPAGGEKLNMWDVYNPHPRKFMLTWSLPENLRRKKIQYGAEVVTAEDGVKLYRITSDKEIDKTNNWIKRGSQVLIRYAPDAYAARLALAPYLALKGAGVDIEAFQKDEGARNVEHDEEMVRRNRRVEKATSANRHSPTNAEGKRKVPGRTHLADVLAMDDDSVIPSKRTVSPRKIAKTPLREEEIMERLQDAEDEVPMIGAMSIDELDGDDDDE